MESWVQVLVDVVLGGAATLLSWALKMGYAKIDQLDKNLHEHALEASRRYATREDMKDGESRMQTAVNQINDKLDRIMDKMDNKMDRNLGH